MRTVHYIKPNHKSETPQRAMWLSLDFNCDVSQDKSESVTFTSGSAICGTRSSRTGKWFTREYAVNSAPMFCELLDKFAKKKTRTYIICHSSNWTLTLLNVLTDAPMYGWNIKQAVLGCPPCIVKLKGGNRSVTILDVQNIWPTLSYGTYGGANTAVQPKTTANVEQSLVTKPSIKIVQDMMRKTTEWWNFLKDNDLGGFSPTVGTQSVRVWRHRFMTHKILIDLHDDALKLARDGLFGGRVECFRVGTFNEPMEMLDINASYPYCMSVMNVPTKLLGYSENLKVEELYAWHDKYAIIADIEVETESPAFPYRREQRVVFPVGKFRTVLCAAELAYALRTRQVKRVVRAAVYERAPAFSAYMQYLWTQRGMCRSVGLVEDSEKFKALMSAFFGKWAQHGGYWESVGQAEDLSCKCWIDLDWQTGFQAEFRQFGGLLQKRNIEQESTESHPAIAACVTSEARWRLYALITKAGWDHTYYVDTDSVLVDAVGCRRLSGDIAPNQFGGLKVQGTYQSVQIYGPKHYRLDGQARFSGVSKSAVSVSDRVFIQSQGRNVAEEAVGGNGSRILRPAVRRSYKDETYKGLVEEGGRVRTERI